MFPFTPVIECAPNFSDGRHKEVVESLATSIASTDGCTLLDVDPGVTTNRTVFTFVGCPEAVVEGAFNAAKVAYTSIDMSEHFGDHPRVGALDVCPFVPVQNATMADCVRCARWLAERLADELGVASYLYGEAASRPERRDVSYVRDREYEGLEELLANEEPDYGPCELVPNWGVSLVGARNFLVSYSVNLLASKEEASLVAGRLADSLNNVQSIGWYLEEANVSQVSMNISDYKTTSLVEVYNAVVDIAKGLGICVVGSQIVGLVPLQAIIDAANRYIDLEALFIVEEDQKIRLVVDRLGLNSFGLFVPKERIIEFMIKDEVSEGPLLSTSLKNLVRNVGSRSVVPGGGTVAAVVAALGAALATTSGWRSPPGNPPVQRAVVRLHETMLNLMPLADMEAVALDSVRLGQGVSAAAEGTCLIDLGRRRLLDTHLRLGDLVTGCWPAVADIVESVDCVTLVDLLVGVLSLELAVKASHCIILGQLDKVSDEEYITSVRNQATGYLDTSAVQSSALSNRIKSKLYGSADLTEAVSNLSVGDN